MKGSASSRKRNPYSIEELLKKPEKRRKTLQDVAQPREQEKQLIAEEPTVNVETCD